MANTGRNGPYNKRRCSKCGQSGFKGVADLLTHRLTEHGIQPKQAHSTPRVLGSTDPLTTVNISQKELQYSFYNSPKELKLDLGDYVITISRKQS